MVELCLLCLEKKFKKPDSYHYRKTPQCYHNNNFICHNNNFVQYTM